MVIARTTRTIMTPSPIRIGIMLRKGEGDTYWSAVDGVGAGGTEVVSIGAGSGAWYTGTSAC